MPGEPLMCVWQAVFARDGRAVKDVGTESLRAVTASLSHLQHVQYTTKRFDEFFTSDMPDFYLFVKYVYDGLRGVGVPRHHLAAEIEKACWQDCRRADLYKSLKLPHDDVRKLWEMFNRLCKPGSYPPSMNGGEMDFICHKIAETMGTAWTGSTIDNITFAQFLSTLEETLFSSDLLTLIRQTIEDLHSCFVKEVMKVGWMSKRTKKQANWTNWQKRWFILTPVGLTYYETEKLKAKKGDVYIDSQSIVESQVDFSSFRKRLPCRFKVSNKPALEIELSADTELEKSQWIAKIQSCIDSARTGITPVCKLLKDRNRKSMLQKEDSMERMEEEMKKMQVMARSGSVRITEAPNSKSRPPQLSDVREESSNGSFEDYPAPPSPISDDVEEYDNNAYQAQKDKIQVVFSNIDKNGNGKIDKDEFYSFIDGLGLTMTQQESNLVFDTIDIDENGSLCFIEFYEYFVNTIMGESGTNTRTDAQLRGAFMAADRDGNGTISFREFAEYAYSQRRDMAMDRLMQAFEGLDSDESGEISFGEFKQFFTSEIKRSSMGAIGLLEVAEQKGPGIEDFLKGHYNQADAAQLATYLRKRWTAFASFRRPGESGQNVMTGGSGMVADMVPGEYSLLDLACFNDLPPIVPKHVTIKDVEWQVTAMPGKSGKAIFPQSFNGEVPKEIATNETLAYYGCSLADNNQLKVSLLYRHGIQDFTYENNYLEDYVMAETKLGGAGIEKHGFAHLDCPMDDENGDFIIGKFEGDELHLTAFHIPRRHTLYIPPFVIHCNDYLKGTWRTMLSDEANIDHVQLVKKGRQANMETYEHFRFQFVKDVSQSDI